MKRVLWLLTGILLAGVAVWYIVKPHDYRVNMKAPALAGTVEQSFFTWAETLDSNQVSRKDERLLQHFKVGEQSYQFEWVLTEGQDRETDISVFISGNGTTIKDRLDILFSESQLVKDSKAVLSDYLDFLENHLSRFKVALAGQDTLPAKYCACVTTETSQQGKAFGMMKNYPLLSGVLGTSSVPLDGRPFLTIKEWDRDRNHLVYDFCYPVKRSDSLPSHPEIFYREFPSIPALKAIYNGNYITSDRAWYHLLKEAESRGIPNPGLPVEIFFNNPNMGGNELQWTAEIYLPLEKKE